MAKLNDILKGIRKSTGSTPASQSVIGNVEEYYDTGSLALNRVLTGNLFNGGIPKGRITTFYGESGSGKSLIAAQTASIALKNGKIDRVFYVDSEAGGLQIFKTFGVDLDCVEHIPVVSVEDMGVKLLKLLDALIEAHNEHMKNPDSEDEIRSIIILDSLGVRADKVLTDAVKKDQLVQDMGLTAKLKNTMMSACMMRVPLANTTMIVINHAYDNPGAMFTSKVKAMGGGKLIEYASHVIVQCSKLLIKKGDADFETDENADDGKTGFFGGNRMKFFLVKNREAIPGYEATVYIDFKHGMTKYDGLIDDAITYGFVTAVHGGYSVPTYNDGKKIKFSTLATSDEVWNTFIDAFNKESQKRMTYSTAITRELDQMEEDMDNEAKSAMDEQTIDLSEEPSSEEPSSTDGDGAE